MQPQSHVAADGCCWRLWAGARCAVALPEGPDVLRVKAPALAVGSCSPRVRAHLAQSELHGVCSKAAAFGTPSASDTPLAQTM